MPRDSSISAEHKRRSQLPSEASEASHLRYSLGTEIVRSCALALGREIALTGSVSWGVADQYSDMELSFWQNELPSSSARERWLRDIGATDITIDSTPAPDQSTWSMFRFGDVWVEAAWYTTEFHEAQLEALRKGEIIDHDPLRLAWTIVQARALRSEGRLAGWQRDLADYPDEVQQQLIADAVGAWTLPNHLFARWAEVYRGHRHTVVEELVRDLNRVFRIIFAINRQWEPDWKWIEPASRNLTLKPRRLVERTHEILATPHLEQAAAGCMELSLETLALIPPPYDVTRAASNIRESLRAHTR
jgi:hypothetical protein